MVRLVVVPMLVDLVEVLVVAAVAEIVTLVDHMQVVMDEIMIIGLVLMLLMQVADLDGHILVVTLVVDLHLLAVVAEQCQLQLTAMERLILAAAVPVEHLVKVDQV